MLGGSRKGGFQKGGFGRCSPAPQTGTSPSNRFVHKNAFPPPPPQKSVNFEDSVICAVFPHFGPFSRGEVKPSSADKNPQTLRRFPGTKNRNEGTFAKSALLRNRPFVSSRSPRGGDLEFFQSFQKPPKRGQRIGAARKWSKSVENMLDTSLPIFEFFSAPRGNSRKMSKVGAELQVTHLRWRTPICGFLQFSEKVFGFLRNLRFSAVSCALQMLEFPREGVNLRKSAVFCENLRFGLSVTLGPSPYPKDPAVLKMLRRSNLLSP